MTHHRRFTLAIDFDGTIVEELTISQFYDLYKSEPKQP